MFEVLDRTLLVLRHAKSRWDEPGKTDFDRDLAPRGIKAATRIGRWLNDQGYAPDQVLCSSAVRAQATWRLASAELAAMPSCKFFKSLYLAPPSRIKSIIARQSAEHRSLLVIGHNPGLHQFCIGLLGSRAPAELRTNLPTGGLLIVRLPVADWTDNAGAELVDYVVPRQLSKLD